MTRIWGAKIDNKTETNDTSPIKILVWLDQNLGWRHTITHARHIFCHALIWHLRTGSQGGRHFGTSVTNEDDENSQIQYSIRQYIERFYINICLQWSIQSYYPDNLSNKYFHHDFHYRSNKFKNAEAHNT